MVEIATSSIPKLLAVGWMVEMTVAVAVL